MHLPQPFQSRHSTQHPLASRCARHIAVYSTLVVLLALAPAALADDRNSGRSSYHHGHRANGHGFGTHNYGFQGSSSHRGGHRSTWGHGYGSLFGGHGFLVTQQNAKEFGGLAYVAGRHRRGNHHHHLRSIGHPSRWLYNASYLSTYYASSPYFTYKSTSPIAPAAAISGYDGTIGSYLGYEPLPVKPKAEIDARPQPASLNLTVEPDDASIYLDGRFLGVASELNQSLLVAPGTHRLEVARPGYDSLELELDVTTGETLEIQRTLTTAGSN